MLLRRLPKGGPRRYSVVATAKAAAVPRIEVKPHVPPIQPLQYTHLRRMDGLKHQPLTMLPTPLPEDLPQNEAYFPSSKKQQFLAVIAACLKDLYDVPRAEEIFQRLRQEARTGVGVLTIDTYNALLLAFAQLQAENTVLDHHIQHQWSEKLWNLWDILEQEQDRVALNTTSVAIAFLAHVRAPNDEVHRPSPSRLLELILEKKLSVLDVLASPVLGTQIDQDAVLNLITEAAQVQGRPDILENLHSRDSYIPNIGSRGPATRRTAIDVPEVKPVEVIAKTTADGIVTTDIPYNLQSLRTNLETVSKTPDAAVYARQMELETSAYDTTIEKLKHEMEKLDLLGLGATSKLKDYTLQQWMYKWLQATEVKLEKDIEALAQKERTTKASVANPIDSPLTPFLRLLNPSKLAMITIIELMRLHGTGGVAEGMKTSRALIGVGRAVELECMAEWGKKQRRAANLEGVYADPNPVKKKDGRGRKKLVQEVDPTAEPTDSIEEYYKRIGGTPPEDVLIPGTKNREKRQARVKKSPKAAAAMQDLASADKPKRRGRAKKLVEAAVQDLAETTDEISLAAPETISAEEALEQTATTQAEFDAEEETGLLQDLSSGMPEWTQIVRVRVGSVLVDTLMESAVVTRTVTDADGKIYSEDQPAFMHSYEYIRGKKLGVIKLNGVVGERMARDSVRETLHPRHLPMLVRPQPWEDYDKGGYLNLRSTVMRIKNSAEQLSYLRHASAAGHVDLVYECLDALGETPWRINDKILNVVLEVWNQGKGMAGIPPAQLDIEEPPKPADFAENPRARATYLARMKGILNDKRNNHGERCHVNYKLEVARAFVNDEIYMPHNLDFRGRAYPIPPHLNHIGDDLSRGLLLFAERRPLGQTGLRWLRIHLSNVFGFDKASFDEREQFVINNMDKIRDSAENPLTGDQWWLKADDPWQCLATCMELCEAMKMTVPEMYESNLPVHQDGTCNGLQHYAALGGDTAGAQHVNLQEGDRPADVYSHVAGMVNRVVDAEAAAGDEAAKLVQGKISRKVVKQTVMTTVYGVTFIGARDQIEKQLRDVAGISREDAWNVASYLAKRVLGCIGDLFSGASQIQHWLSLSARLIAKSIPADRMKYVLEGGTPKDAARERMTSVIWTTALGLPIVQPYRKAKKKQILTALQTVFISDPNLPTQVDPVKQSAAFPPNFVHSLDATHMMLTALECRSASITFASVHDSYWTHASTVDEMSGIIRDTFIALHSSDILQKLREEFVDRYKGYRVPLSSLTDREICSILRTLAHPEHEADPKLLSLMLALVHRSTSRYAKEDATKKAIAAVREKLSHAELEAGEQSVQNAEAIPEVEEAAPSDESVAEEEPVEETIEDPEEAPAKPKRKSAAKPKPRVVAGKLDSDLQYIELTTILPRLPEKGTFDVSDIKRSQYFFS